MPARSERSGEQEEVHTGTMADVVAFYQLTSVCACSYNFVRGKRRDRQDCRNLRDAFPPSLITIRPVSEGIRTVFAFVLKARPGMSLEYCSARPLPLSPRLKIVVALWFVVQIVLPFTAPLQTIDLTDLFGSHSHHQTTQLTPESCSIPTTARRPTINAPLKAATLSTAAPALTLPPEWSSRPGTSALGFMISPRQQQTVLRI
jgi:hypothetical protein